MTLYFWIVSYTFIYLFIILFKNSNWKASYPIQNKFDIWSEDVVIKICFRNNLSPCLKCLKAQNNSWGSEIWGVPELNFGLGHPNPFGCSKLRRVHDIARYKRQIWTEMYHLLSRINLTFKSSDQTWSFPVRNFIWNASWTPSDAVFWVFSI